MFRLARRKNAGSHIVATNHTPYFCKDPIAIRQYLKDHKADQPIKEDEKVLKKVKKDAKYTQVEAPKSLKIKHLPKPCPDRFKAGDAVRSRSKLDDFDETGLLAEMCPRHEIVRSVADIFHGERFAYVDFAMEALIKRVNEATGDEVEKRKVILFYDVNCQYYPHTLKTAPHVDPHHQIIPAHPVFHVRGHEKDCQLIYHPLRIPLAGLVDGECTERLWSDVGCYHNTVKEMLACTRHEQIEDLIFHFNKLKIAGLGKSLASKMESTLNSYQNAVEMFAAVVELHDLSLNYVHKMITKQREGNRSLKQK